MASNGFKKLMVGMEELGEMLNQGDEYFDTLYSSVSKDELDEYRNGSIVEDLTEALEDYKLTYYLSTATAERRPETMEDFENDWIEETFAADSDLDACKYAYEQIQMSYMDDFDFKNVADFVEYCEMKDLGDGSPFIVKLEGPNGVIYDMGQTKEDFIAQIKQNDEMLAYYRGVLGIDESLNENSVSSKIPEAIDQFLQDIAQMYQTISYKDIMDHDYTAEDLQKLAKLRGKFRREINYADSGDEEAVAVCEKIANDVAEVLKRVDESMNEGRNDPYFTPYGYRAAAKVLNRTAPEYYWHLKEIEMDKGDGIKLANYALKKGLPVMIDKNSDPDYPEFYLKDGSSEYHWGDYFYTYGFTNPDATDLVPYEGNLDILNTEKDDNKMNEDMSIRAKLKALYPELDFDDGIVEKLDEEMISDHVLIGFNHFSPEDLIVIHGSKEDLETINDDRVDYFEIIPVTDKLLWIENNDEYLQVSNTDFNSIDEFRNAVEAEMQKNIDAGNDEFEILDLTSFYIDEDSEGLSAQELTDKFMDWIDESFVDNDSNSAIQLIKGNELDDHFISYSSVEEFLESLEDEEDWDDDTDFDIDESAEYNFMEALYKGADFDNHDDEVLEESSDCEDDECWENDLISDDYDDGV